ncbi:relaxase/mobilization nuclease family protein [Methylophilaceae bacterium 11]|nr:relaxase/mobilization nuclease family protein [Methylophilaceae bacterium 11]
MISKRIAGRKDGKSSATTALRYGEGLTPDRETGLILDKSHRTRLGNFGLVDDGVYEGLNITEMSDLINMAAFEMQSNCDLNTRVGVDKKLAHFVVSYNQVKPSEAVLRDTEDSMLSVMALDENHFATFLHNDNGYWHLHIFVSRIEKGSLHRGNALWHDQINRDKVCCEVEIRHNLPRDNHLHIADELGQIAEIPREERRAKRDSNFLSVSDRTRTTEIYSGEKSFQTWVNEIRIGDRLKHAKSWQDLHAAAAAYGCEVKPKGAGYVIIPVGEKGGIQLSKIGLKNLTFKFGAFQNAEPGQQAQPDTEYKPAPTLAKAASHYDQWSVAKDTFKPIKTALINEQRELHRQIRKNLQVQHKANLEKIRAGTKGQDRFVAVSVTKMEHAIALAILEDQFAHNRQVLHKQLAEQGPGNTFRDYLVKEASNGDELALTLAQKYAAQHATKVTRQQEADYLQIVAAATGYENKLAQRTRLNFTHRIERNGTVIYDLGRGRLLTDSAISKQVQLNNMAANSPEAISTALQFASARFGRTLTLYGTQEFQRLAVETAVNKGLAINFADPTLDAYREKLLLDKQKIAFNHRKQQSLRHGQKGEEISQSRHEITPVAESPIKAFEPAIDPLQEWKGANPEMVQTYSQEGEGKVLHVLSDGRWIQNKGRGNFAVQPSSLGVQLQVGNNVFVGKNGSVELLSDKSKLAR